MTRDEAVAIYGPITTAWDCHPHPSERWQAYFENELDDEMPPWARAFGATEAEAIANLLEQAAEHHAEREALILQFNRVPQDSRRADELERRR